MEEIQEQGGVYVQKPTDFSASLSTHKMKNPAKRCRPQENSASAVVWCNLEKSKPGKFRCTEFDMYITKAISSQNFFPMEHLDRGQQVDAIRNDSHFEKSEGDKELSSSEPTSSTSTECAGSSTDSESSKPSQPSDAADGKIFLQCQKTSTVSKTGTDSNPELNTDPEDETAPEFNNVTDASLMFEVKNLPDSSFVSFHLEDANSHLDQASVDQMYVKKTTLIDVDVTVNANYRPEKVPLVCLTSKFNGRAILGHPLEVEELTDSYKTLLPGKENGGRKLCSNEGTFHQLVWKTARRTPVCYVTDSVSSVVKKAKARPAGEDGGGLILNYPSQFKFGRTASEGTCVPVGCVFNRLLVEVGQLQS